MDYKCFRTRSSPIFTVSKVLHTLAQPITNKKQIIFDCNATVNTEKVDVAFYRSSVVILHVMYLLSQAARFWKVKTKPELIKAESLHMHCYSLHCQLINSFKPTEYFETLTSYVTRRNVKANKGRWAVLQMVVSSFCLEI